MVTLLLLLVLGCEDKPEDGDTGAPPGSDTDTAADTAADTDSGGDSDTALEADADGDGHDAVAAGGGDCDDGDPEVHPGATELCDAVDHDCDGDALAGARCADLLDPDAAVEWIVESEQYTGGAAGMVGDLTGDGVDDLLRTTQYGGWYAVVPGGGMPEAPVVVPGDAWLAVEELEYSVVGMELADVGDVNGDGARDLGVIDHARWGATYLFFGPFSEADRLGWADFDAQWPGYAQTEDNWAIEVVSGADFDQDGRDDMVVANPKAWDAEDLEGYDVDAYFGGAWDEQCAIGNHRGGTPWLIGDIDGDGVKDLVIDAGNVPFVLSGTELRTSCDSTLEDVATAWLDGPLAGDFSVGPWADLGDWTGDGVPDLAGSAPSSDTSGLNDGEVYFFSGSDVRGEFSGAALGSWVPPSDPDDGLGRGLYAADFDGDGVHDVFVDGGVAGARWSVFRGGDVPSLRDPLPERRLSLGGGDGYTGGQPGDFDADGRADLWHVVYSEEGPTLLGVIRGFEVPWEDETVW